MYIFFPHITTSLGLNHKNDCLIKMSHVFLDQLILGFFTLIIIFLNIRPHKYYFVFLFICMIYPCIVYASSSASNSSTVGAGLLFLCRPPLAPPRPEPLLLNPPCLRPLKPIMQQNLNMTLF
jgi:hypothetical protein